jgi:POT family proton-dependent oligopeptide transporter
VGALLLLRHAALLIFYLTKHWLFGDEQASVIYGAYTALVYITPVLGGYLADRYLGQRKAVLFGAVLLTFGHFLMAFEGGGGQADPAINIFWLALSFIIVGSGFLKANISVIVGQLYPRTDIRATAPTPSSTWALTSARSRRLAVRLRRPDLWLGLWFRRRGRRHAARPLVFYGKPADGPRRGADPRAARADGLSSMAVYLSAFARRRHLALISIRKWSAAVCSCGASSWWLRPLHGGAKLPRAIATASSRRCSCSSGRSNSGPLFEQAGSSLQPVHRTLCRSRPGVPAFGCFQSINPRLHHTACAALRLALDDPSPAAAWSTRLPPNSVLALIPARRRCSWCCVARGGGGRSGFPPGSVIFILYLRHTTGETLLSPVGGPR